MNNEEKILALLEKHDAMFEKQAAMLEKLTTDMDEVKTGVSDLKAKVADMDDRLIRMDGQLRRVAVTQENQIDKLVSLLDEDYSNISAKVISHDNVLKSHAQRLAALEKAH